MSSNAGVIVVANLADEVMKPLTQPGNGMWDGTFAPLGGSIYGWFVEFDHVRPRTGLLQFLETLPWPHPESVQVLMRDEEDDCFGLWMMRDGVLAEARPQRARDAPRTGRTCR